VALLNVSFEDGTGGAATHWTVLIVSAGEIVAQFAALDGLLSSVDRFLPGWENDDYLNAIGIGTPAQFDTGLVAIPRIYDAFDKWITGSPKIYHVEIGGGTAAVFFGGAVWDGFNANWNNTPYRSTMPDGSSESDTFETGWVVDYATSIVSGTDALFTGGSLAYETFAPFKQDILFTVDWSTDVFTSVAHGLNNNQPVTVTSTGALPDPLAKNVVYYVIYIDANTFKLSLNPGPGTAVNITTVGTGDHTLKVSPAAYWTEVE